MAEEGAELLGWEGGLVWGGGRGKGEGWDVVGIFLGFMGREVGGGRLTSERAWKAVSLVERVIDMLYWVWERMRGGGWRMGAGGMGG